MFLLLSLINLILKLSVKMYIKIVQINQTGCGGRAVQSIKSNSSKLSLKDPGPNPAQGYTMQVSGPLLK